MASLVTGINAPDLRRAGAAVGIDRDLDDLMKRGVGHEQDVAFVIELDAVVAPNGGVKPIPGPSSGPVLHTV